MRSILIPLVAALLLGPALRPMATHAQAPAGASLSPADSIAADSVVLVVERVLHAISTQDYTAIRQLLLPQGQLFGTVVEGDSVHTFAMTNEEAARMFGQSEEPVHERMWNPTVLVRGPYAVVWAPYDFHVDGAFSHCGVDTFTLVRTPDGWRVAHLSYTIEEEGCAPSPLGPLESSEGVPPR